MASVFKAAANREIENQPVYLRYKGSILIALSGLAWVLAELATSEDIAELGWSGTIGAAATVVAFLVNRFTKDGITPSMAERLERSGQAAFLDRPSASHIAAYEPVEVQSAATVEDVEPASTDGAALADATPPNGSTSPELPIYYGDSTAD